MVSVDQFLATLGSYDRAQARELARQLRISQPSLSRLIKAAGDRICRMRAGRATSYARTRSLSSRLGTQLPVHRIDEKGTTHQYGVLHLLANRHHWLERTHGPSEFFEGLPPFAADMSPQGYIGRGFTARYPELELPPRIADWTDDHQLLALAQRGEDCTGNLIIGVESLNRFLAQEPQPVHPRDYPELARASMAGQPGSSAGGEQPKFAAYSEGRHVLVKFSGDEGAAAQRWRDLLVCESLALEAIRTEGIPAATARSLSIEGRRFLEVERFDRVGSRGRSALLSLGAIDDEYFGHRDTWTKAALRMLTARSIDAEDARRMRWLDTFGQLTGNSDRHFGNLSFFVGDDGRFRLAPVYDMLPMIFAPVGTDIIERHFEPAPPTADTLDVWPQAARCAVAYWGKLGALGELSGEFRQLALRCRDAVAALAARF